MTGFNNPIIGGGGALVYPAIHSPNFLAGSAGWTVNKDGSAEFNNAVIRNGTVISGTAFFYSGAAALGNLIASIAAVAGTDAKGNAYLSGITSYDTVNNLAASSSGGQLTGWHAPGPGGPWTQITAIGVAGAADLSLNSNRDIFCQVPVGLLGQAAPSALAGRARLFADTTGQPGYVNAAGLQMGLSGAQLADFTQFTVTQNTLQDITKAWSIPAGAPVGSIWELTVSGSGSTPAAATTLQFGALVGATAGNAGTFGANTFASAVNPFRFKVTYTIMITATGAGGTFDNEMNPVVAIAGNWIPGNSANFIASGTTSNTGGLAIDTTVPSVVKVQAAWGAVVAGGLTARRSTFRRIA